MANTETNIDRIVESYLNDKALYMTVYYKSGRKRTFQRREYIKIPEVVKNYWNESKLIFESPISKIYKA